MERSCCVTYLHASQCTFSLSPLLIAACVQRSPVAGNTPLHYRHSRHCGGKVAQTLDRTGAGGGRHHTQSYVPAGPGILGYVK